MNRMCGARNEGVRHRVGVREEKKSLNLNRKASRGLGHEKHISEDLMTDRVDVSFVKRGREKRQAVHELAELK